MAEGDGVYELEELENHLQTLLSRYSSDDLRVDCRPFCSDFCKVVEEFAARWQVPLPQLRILKIALCFFAQASPAFTLNCDIVHQTISSLALSVFELLLFFDQKDLHQEPLKQFTVAFQECNLALARHQNVHLLQVERLICEGGPWACPLLKAILSDSSLPQNEVDGFISSELPVLFELRVRYLLSCERVSEAMALAKCCAWHPTAGQHLFFLQVYLSWLLKTSQHDILHKEVAGLDGKDAVYIICSLEYEEQDELLLALSRVFLSQQLCRGDMHCLCDLVLIWSTFHHRLKTPKKVLLDEIHLLMQSATNVNSIFPFIKAVLQEAGDDGIQFCVELCANGLQSCLPCDIITKSLIYKTIASLLPNDLEVCRACALLVFFLERTVEAYKTAYLLYMHPDQDYHVDHSPIRNHIRFEMLQVLKKDLHFDPEFWNLIALRTNCLKLLSEKVVSSALEEIMEDKWILNYCSKETAPASSKPRCQKGNRGARSTQRRYRTGDRLKEDLAIPSKRLRLGPGKTLFNVDRTVKRKNTQASRTVKGRTAEPLRRSFWQLDGLKDSRGYEDRRITRLSEKNPPKRRIRTPKWLLEDSGTLEKNKSRKKIKKHGLKHQKNLEVSTEKSSEAIQIKNNAKHKPNTNCESLTREASGKHQKGSSADSLRPASPQVILELSLPDNELFGTFSEDTCNRQRGLPQVLFYKPTMKRPTTSQPVKTVHRKEVILRTRDLTMFVQQLHCYTRRLKGKGTGTSVQGSVSKITRSSVQGMPSKGTEKNGSSDATLEDKDVFVSPPPKAEEAEECSVLEKAQTIEAGSPKSGTEPFKSRGADDLQSESQVLDGSTDHILQTHTSKHREFATQLKVASALQRAAEDKLTEAPALEKGRHGQTKEPCDVSAVEMKVTFASQTPTAGKLLESSVLDEVSKIPPSADVSAVGRSPVEDNPVISSTAGAISMHALTQSSVLKNERRPEPSPLPSQISLGCPETATKVNNSISSTVTSAKLSDGQSASTTDASAPDKGSTVTPPGSDSINDMSDFTEMVSKQPPPDISGDFIHEKRPNFLHKSHNSFSCSFPEQRISAVDDTQEKNEDSDDFDAESSMNTEPVESEESRLEFCCTFCKKVFNGSRVVAHAMFHFRKDECMFCGTMFKDDLLAMMHLSDHIEKLKKSKEFAGNKVQEKQLCDTKDDPTSNSPAKANTNSSGSRCRGRPRKCAIGPKQMSLRESGTQGTRKLRSSIETPVAPCGQGKQANELKNLNMRTPGPKINGNVAKNTVLERLKMVILNSKAKQPRPQKGEGAKKQQGSLSSDQQTVMEMQHVPKTTSKHNSRVVQDKNVAPQQKVFCPVEGCTWALVLSKNRVALLYHALEEHCGDIRPLKLAFRIGNGKCSICMRVLWSFEHFQHHVERHRLTPRHPCLHQGCTERFKTGMEMRRHTRKHSPLQAVCCLPGCSKLFICLWALNLHEREHYSSKSVKPDKNSNKQTSEKSNIPSEKTQRDPCNGSDAVDEAVCVPRHSRGEPVSSLSTEKHKLGEALPKRDVLKNLSNKETSEQPAGPNLRLRRDSNIHIASQKYRALLKNKFSSSFFKRKMKERQRLKRRLKINKTLQKRGRPTKLMQVGRTMKDKTTETSKERSEPKKSANKRFKKNPIKQNGVPQNTSASLEKRYLSSSSRLSKSKRPTVESTHLNLVAAQMAEEGNVKDVDEQAENKDSTHKLCHDLLLNDASGEQTEKITGEKSQKLRFTKKRSNKNKQTVSESKKNNERKTHSHLSNPKTKLGSKACSKSVKSSGVHHDEDKAEEEDGTKPAAFNPGSDSCGTSLTALPANSLNEGVPLAQARDENRKEETTLETSESCVKTSDSTDVGEKHNVPDGGGAQAATDTAHGAQEMVSERSRVEGGTLSSPVLESGAKSRSYSVKINGQVAPGNSSVCIETLAEYGKKPYKRLPPTAYLDERYTTMPKRRKEMTFSPSSERIPVKEEVGAPLQRQRCANCFVTFSSTDELQAHLQLQKCSNLFGFDSDDEGNS
ncbi:hypothetical protein fugu_002344 [Takifugu bimaculatus]|uniref:C2H2-type domain-containing protein n=1 Tax=Takifugu bimaculatus TaxID=433685 RepID=A0A4Z2BR20_9TELE|nr:hypothetical protein fugu_002344 [Takifugu bimaculatus]